MSDGSRAAAPPGAVAVVGAGTMGAGMALSFAWAGSAVHLTARREATLERAAARVAASLETFERHGMRPPDGAAATRARIRTSTRLEDLDPATELVLETIAEDLDAKREVLSRVEALVGDRAVVATNTSSLPLEDLATAFARPARFAGLHWFNPPELVRLVEVVPAPGTAASTLARLRDWSLAVGKEPVVLARRVEGFVANRLQYALLREAYALVRSGVCSIADVDRAVTSGLGARWAAVGPFETMDLAGLDVHREVVRRLFPALACDGEVPEVVERLVEEGALGCKSGRGLYGDYAPEDLERLLERRAAVLLAVGAVVDGMQGEGR